MEKEMDIMKTKESKLLSAHFSEDQQFATKSQNHNRKKAKLQKYSANKWLIINSTDGNSEDAYDPNYEPQRFYSSVEWE